MQEELKNHKTMEDLKDFYNGIIPFLERFVENFKIMFNILNANLLPYNEKNKVLFEIKEIENSLKEILNKFKNILLEVSQDYIEQEANRQYYSFFKDDANPDKMNYVKLLLQYLKLKELYNFTLNNLDYIKKMILEKFSPQTIFYQQFVDFQMKTCYFKLHKLHLFLKRLEIILQYDKSLEKHKKIFELVHYSPRIEYRFSLIFKEDLENYIKSFFPEEKKSQEELLNLRQNQLSEEEIYRRSEILKKNVYIEKEKSYIKNNILDTSGKYLWNSSMYYFLSYDIQKLKKEESFFNNVFFIDTHLGANPQLVRSKIVRTLIRKDKILTKEQAQKQYNTFLDSLFALNRQILILNFQIPEKIELLFLYHLGPLVFFHINKQYLMDLKTGNLHQIVHPEKNIIRKVIPNEYIKKSLFQWWIDNVMGNLTEEDKNNYILYQSLISHIQKVVSKIQEEFIKTHSQKEANQTNPKFLDFLKERLGHINLLLIQRYLNIFKHIEIS